MSSFLTVKKTSLWEKIAILCVILIGMVFEARADVVSISGEVPSTEETIASSSVSVATETLPQETSSSTSENVSSSVTLNEAASLSESSNNSSTPKTESIKSTPSSTGSPASRARVELDVVQPLVALVVVFGAMFFIAWLLKKGKLVRHLPKGILKQVAVLPIGGKESVAIIECGDTWLVVGITAHQITLLHTLSKEDLPETQVENHDIPFKKWLETTAERLRSSRSS